MDDHHASTPSSISEFDSMSDVSDQMSDSDLDIITDSDREGQSLPEQWMSGELDVAGTIEEHEGLAAVTEGYDEGETPGVDAQATIGRNGVAPHRLVEDIREREALEQSMVSTLSTSRNGSLSASASTSAARPRSARLSLEYPDPLSPSRCEELNRSYDNVQAEDVSPSSPSPPPLSPAREDPNGIDAGVVEDPVRALTTEVLQPQHGPYPDFQIVLYGSQHPSKFSVVEMLLAKLAESSGLLLSKRQPVAPRVSSYMLDGKGKPFMSAFTVQVIDSLEEFNVAPASGELPSLAIIFLPSFLPSLPAHTLYLPIVDMQEKTDEVSNPDEGFSFDLFRAGIDRQWEEIRNPISQTLLWHVDSPTAVMSEEEIAALDATEVSLGFEPLLPRRRRTLNLLGTQITPGPAVTLLAVLSIVLGYIVSMSSPIVIPTERQVVSAVVKAFANSTHLSTSTAPSPSPFAAENPLAVLSVITSSLSTIAPSTQEQPSAILTPSAKPDVKTKTTALNPTTHCTVAPSLVLSSTTKSLSVIPANVKSISVPPESAYELSTRLASSIQDFFNPKIVADAIRADLKELLDAIDELLRVISVNAQMTASLSLNAAGQLRDKLRRRHRRAQDRARRLREKGTQVWSDASKRVSERMQTARRRAKTLQTHFGSEAHALVKRVQQRFDVQPAHGRVASAA